MDSERATRAANNKSLRIIKNELEALAERGFLTDAQFDTITTALPAEQSLSGPGVRSPLPTPTTTPQNHNPYQAPSHNSNPIPALTGMHHQTAHADAHSDATPAPPSYQQAAPAGPPAVPQHREVGHAVALWAYNTPDQRDLNFAAGDHISVMEFVNPEWWMGKNCRTGGEGIFPSNYVRSENHPSPLATGQPAQSPAGGYYGEKQGYPGQQQQQPYQPYQAQQQQQDPYNSHVPPVAIANEPQQEGDGKGGKAQEMGKKFGKKLGNAAIFGAGATIGGNIVNSIF